MTGKVSGPAPRRPLTARLVLAYTIIVAVLVAFCGLCAWGIFAVWGWPVGAYLVGGTIAFVAIMYAIVWAGGVIDGD